MKRRTTRAGTSPYQTASSVSRAPIVWRCSARSCLRTRRAACDTSGLRDGWDADFSPADSLARLLHEATNTRVLHIREAKPLFQSHDSVYEALAELPNLKELPLYCIKAISLLRSRPAIIENGLWKDGPRAQGDVTPFGQYINSFPHIKLWERGCMLESVVDRFIWPNVTL